MKDVTGELNFLYDDKHQSFKQADIIFFDKFCQACPKYPEKFCNILAMNEWTWFFCMQVNIKLFHKLIPLFLTVVVKCVQSTQNNTFTIS